jgi:hypothetical protein
LLTHRHLDGQRQARLHFMLACKARLFPEKFHQTGALFDYDAIIICLETRLLRVFLNPYQGLDVPGIFIF